MVGVIAEDVINFGLGVRGDAACRLGSEETGTCWFVFSALETKGSKPGLDSEDSFSWTPHRPMDSVYDEGGEVLGVVIVLILEAPDDDGELFPRLACSQTSASEEIFKFSLSMVVKYSSDKHLL